MKGQCFSGEKTPYLVSLSVHIPKGKYLSNNLSLPNSKHCVEQHITVQWETSYLCLREIVSLHVPQSVESETFTLACGLRILPSQSLNSSPWQIRSLALSDTFGLALTMHLKGFYFSLSLQSSLILPSRCSLLGCSDTCGSYFCISLVKIFFLHS